MGGRETLQVRSAKRRWKCDAAECTQKTFTEWVPQLRSPCRLTERQREQAAVEIPERGNTRERRPVGRFAKVMAAVGSDLAGQEIAAAWIGEERLRCALNLNALGTGLVPCKRDVRGGRLAARRDWCAQTMTSPSRSPWPGRYPVGKRDRRRRPNRDHEFLLREPEPARQARSPLPCGPQPGKRAQARPRRLHLRHTAALTPHRRQGKGAQ
jgi:hypothetical protein